MSTSNAVQALSAIEDVEVVENERLDHRTSYHIGGKAALFITCHSYHALRSTIKVLLREDVEWAIFGRGTNILVADEGYNGAVLTLGREFRRVVVDEESACMTAGAGAMLSRVVNEALNHSLAGMEFAVGVPGTLGGAVSMNAGTRSDWMSEVIEEVTVYAPTEERLKHYRYDEIEWGYRTTSLPKSDIVLEVKLRLRPGNKITITERMERSLRRRRRSQPAAMPSCGSVFKNPPERSVGKMIEDCGLKGFSVGGAEVSEVHGNFIVNTGSATAADVVKVMQKVYATVKDTYGVELQPEVKFLGF